MWFSQRPEGKLASEAQPAADSRHPTPRFVVLEVSDFGTLMMPGAEEAETHADLFPEIDPQTIVDVESARKLIDSCSELSQALERWADDDWCEVTREWLSEKDTPSACRCRCSGGTQPCPANASEWLAQGGASRIAFIRGKVEDWLSDPIDWEWIGAAPYADPAGQALAHCEGMDEDELEWLDIQLIHGDQPGSCCFYAQLMLDIEEANAIARKRGIELRFVPEGKTYVPVAADFEEPKDEDLGKDCDQECDDEDFDNEDFEAEDADDTHEVVVAQEEIEAEVEEQREEASVDARSAQAALEQLAQRLAEQFMPRFGLRADIAWGGFPTSLAQPGTRPACPV